MPTKVVVKRRGQITIPAELRRKLGIQENSKLEIGEVDGKIVLTKRPSIFDLAESGVGKGNVDEIKKELDRRMRAEDG